MGVAPGGADFSELSDLALKYAAAGAKAYGAELTVFHAEYFDLPTYFTAAEVEQLTAHIKGLRRDVGELLRQHVQTLLGPLANEISIAYAVKETRPVEGMLTMAADRKADLIVLGRQPRAHLWDWFFGGVTELVLRHAPAPVLMVPPRVS